MEIPGAAAFDVSLSATPVHGLKSVSVIRADQRFAALHGAGLERRSASRQGRGRGDGIKVSVTSQDVFRILSVVKNISN